MATLAVEPLTFAGAGASVLTAALVYWREARKQGDTKLDLASGIALNLADRLNTEARQAKDDLQELREEFDAFKARATEEHAIIRERMNKCEADRAILLELAKDAGKDTSSLTP